MRVEEINPYTKEGDKTGEVEEMFDSIAPAYDFMNNAMTLGMHRSWRNKALNRALSLLTETNGLKILDVATGTGDVAFRLHELLGEAEITGIDLSEGMLKIAREKLMKIPRSQRSLLAFGKADSLNMPFHDQSFDLITVAYGVRNFSNLPQGLKEMKRVMKPGGVLCIIELSCPVGKITSPLYNFYSKKIIPFAGRLISGDSSAYSYLPKSIEACPQREEMEALLRASGFRHVEWKSLTFGAVTYYIAL